MTSPIHIDVQTTYIQAQSKPDRERFVYAYTITIKNNGERPAKLIGRHWIITDANNKVQEVEGMGVVGEQPRIAPGEEFRYTSGVILETETGSMEGSYRMRYDNGDEFDAPIPAFALLPPRVIH